MESSKLKGVQLTINFQLLNFQLTCSYDPARGIAAATLAAVMMAACEGEVPPPTIVQQAASSQTGFFESSGARLSYRLDWPERIGKVPGVVIGHGSGEVTKDHCRDLASGFLARGFATLCYDKRGVGESTGEYSSVGPRNSQQMFDALAEDMASGVRFLRSHDSIDGARIGLAGGSQAGWIIPVAAARVLPAFMVLLVGPTVSVGEEIFYSKLVEQSTRPLKDGYAQLPAFKGERGFDPRPVLESLAVPGLWLLGEIDRSIPTPATAAILDELASQGKPFARVVFPGVGHDLSSAPVWQEIDRWLGRTIPQMLNLTLLGNASVHITNGSLTLVTDFPYQSGAFGYMRYSRSQTQAFRNVVALITHRHLDHFEVDTLKGLAWRVIGPKDVTRQLASSLAIPTDVASPIDPHLRIEAIETPHADVGHVSYVIEWHGRRFYFSGDTEDPGSLLKQRALDIAFVTPWMYQAVRSRGARVDTARVVIYHHTTDERVAGCLTPCEVPTQGAQWSLTQR